MILVTPAAGTFRVWLLGLVVLAAVLRLSALDSNPPGLFRDEANTAYDAYCLALTGHDQHGEFLPLLSKGFGTYDETTYQYLVAPFAAVLGPGALAVRLPAALLGILTVLLLYFFVERTLDERVALAAALLLAVSPWHVHLSRTGFRAVLFPFALVLAAFVLSRAGRGAAWLVTGAMLLGASLHTYTAARVYVPLLIISAAWLYRDTLRAHRRWAVVSGTLFTAILVALATLWLSPAGRVRSAGVFVGFEPLTWLSNYASYFSPGFLFLDGDPILRHSAGGIGELLPIEALTLLLGILLAIRRRRRIDLLLLVALLLYPIPAALTAPDHALRAIVGSVVIAALSGSGLVFAWDWARNGRRILRPVLVFVVAACVGVFAFTQFFVYPNQSAAHWQFGILEAMDLADGEGHDCVVVSNAFLRPHVYALVHEPVAPEVSQANPVVVLPPDKPQVSVDLGRYRFRYPGRPPFGDPGCLHILPAWQAEDLQRVDPLWTRVHEIRSPNGELQVVLTERPATP